jgi:hypothetical protein
VANFAILPQFSLAASLRSLDLCVWRDLGMLCPSRQPLDRSLTTTQLTNSKPSHKVHHHTPPTTHPIHPTPNFNPFHPVKQQTTNPTGNILFTEATIQNNMSDSEVNVTTKPCNRPRKWSPSEDEQLRAAVEKMGERRWKRIAECVSDRSHVQCLQRWQQVLRPGLRKGPWTKQEDVLLRKAILDNVTSWAEVSTVVDGRSAKQCRERWHNHASSKLTPDDAVIFSRCALMNSGSRHARSSPDTLRRSQSTPTSNNNNNNKGIFGQSLGDIDQDAEALRTSLLQYQLIQQQQSGEQLYVQAMRDELNTLRLRQVLEQQNNWRPNTTSSPLLGLGSGLGSLGSLNNTPSLAALLAMHQKQQVPSPHGLGLSNPMSMLSNTNQSSVNPLSLLSRKRSAPEDSTTRQNSIKRHASDGVSAGLTLPTLPHRSVAVSSMVSAALAPNVRSSSHGLSLPTSTFLPTTTSPSASTFSGLRKPTPSSPDTTLFNALIAQQARSSASLSDLIRPTMSSGYDMGKGINYEAWGLRRSSGAASPVGSVLSSCSDGNAKTDNRLKFVCESPTPVSSSTSSPRDSPRPANDAGGMSWPAGPFGTLFSASSALVEQQQKQQRKQ